MAAEEQSQLNFQEILTNINRKFEIISVKWTNDKDFEIRIRTEIDRQNEDFNFLCDEWVDLFSNVTSTIWVKKISNTGPKIRFRKQYQCWTQGTTKVQKELLFDSTKCKGVLDMKVLTDTPLTRRKNKHIRLGLNAVVKINFSHLHPVDTSQPFAFFVHNCHPTIPDFPQILLPDHTTLEVPLLSQKTDQDGVTTVSIADITENFIMFDPSLTHTLSLGQPQAHLVHSHQDLLPNQHGQHNHYIQ